MIYNSAVEQIKGAKAAQSEMLLPVLRLATVTSLSSGGRAYIQFYGESAASSKLYPYLSGYKPTVGDKVLVFQQGSTYIIGGKISKDNVGDVYYLLKSEADTLYLTAEAASTYLTKAVADTLYEPKGGGGGGDVDRIKNNTYYLGFASSSSSTIIGNRISGSTTALDLGSTTYPFNAGYFTTLGGTSESNAIQTLNLKNANVYGNIIPATNSAKNLGSSDKRFLTGYIDTVISTLWRINSSYNTGMTGSMTGSTSNFRPTGNKTIDFGTSSYQWKNVYAQQFYQNGTAISTSDRRKKTGIKDIARKYVSFFRRLKPRLFRFKDGESGRLHSGFIAQEVEEAAIDSGIDNKDLAFLCIDENGNYGLRYEELIAIQTKVIQDLLDRVEALEDKVNERRMP